ncbi:MAG: ComEC/Rec2 family competence protein [Candidatus Uhrbacteria bacterium]
MAWAHGDIIREYLKKIATSPSRFLFVILLSFLAGIIGSTLFLKQSLDNIYLIIPIIIFILILILRLDKWQVPTTVLLFFIFGIFRFNQTFINPVYPSVLDYVGKETVMTGTIAGEIIQREAVQETNLNNLKVNEVNLEGKILFRLPKFQNFSLGQILEFRCELTEPKNFNDFDYQAYLASRGIYAICYQPEQLVVQGTSGWNIKNSLLSLRTALINRLGLIFSEPHAAFMSGVLFGGSGGLSDDLKGDFSRTGLSHVMAASGYNVSIFSQLLLIFLMRSALGRKRALMMAGVLVIVYIFLAGATPPVVRAGIMAATVMLGTWLGRAPHSGNLLLLSGSLMLLVNPRLISDVGFQLSFVSTAGLMLFASWFGERLNFIPKIFALRESVGASLAAITATLPVMLWHFGSISIIAPLVNLLVLPWIPYLMLLGGVALGLGWLSVTLGTITAIPGTALSFFVLLLVNWFGSVSFASLALPKILSAILSFGFFICLLGFVRLKKPKK